MANSNVTEGVVLYLRPEDVVQPVDDGFYARVVSVGDGGVVVEPLGGEDTANESIPASLALMRQVPNEEPTGSRVSTLLRKGVACVYKDSVRFGQAIATSDLGVHVNLEGGSCWLNREDIVCVVPPLFALLMFGLAMQPAYWIDAFTEQAVKRLSAWLTGVGPDGATLEEAMEAINPGMARHVPAGVLRQWVHPLTGLLHTTSVDHALRWAYYPGSDSVAPLATRSTIGSWIGGDPSCEASAAAELVAQPPAKRARQHQGFLASETSFDGGEEEEKTNEVAAQSFVASFEAARAPVFRSGARQALRMRASNARPLAQPVNRMSAPQAGTRHGSTALNQGDSRDPEALSPTQALAILCERLGDDPEAQRLLGVAAGPIRVGSALEFANAPRRNRHAFSPTEAQMLVHDAITSPEFQGASAPSFVHRLLASSAVKFIPYPSVLMLLYEFGFGHRGRSVMHLAGVSVLERMRLQRDHSINMNDFAANVKLPDAGRPLTWAALQDGVNGLVNYCNMHTDPMTARVASTVAGFVATMQAFGHWPETHLDALEFWINEQLGAYRELVDSEVRYGTDDRARALAWFSPTNPTLVPLQNLMLQQDLEAIREASQKVIGHSGLKQPPPAEAAAADKAALPPNVVAAMPKRNGHDLCLRFASKKGCRANPCGFGDRVREHFVEPNLPPTVRKYIIAKFGGLSADYN